MHLGQERIYSSEVIILDEARLTVQKAIFCRATFMSNLYYGHLGKCIGSVLNQVPSLLDKVWSTQTQLVINFKTWEIFSGTFLRFPFG